MSVILACLGGGIGSGLRFLMDAAIRRSWKSRFPLSTFLINLIAALLSGLVAALSARLLLSPQTHLLLATGLLGGFSTFSTAVAETLSLLRGPSWPTGLLYFASTLVAPLLLLAAGFALGMAL